MRIGGLAEGKSAVHDRLQSSRKDMTQDLMQVAQGSHIGAEE